MFINPEVAISDLKNYVHKSGYEITKTVLDVFLTMEEICFKHDLDIYECDLLLPLIMHCYKFRDIIDKYGGNSNVAIDSLNKFYDNNDHTRDGYQIDQELYSQVDEDIPNIRQNFINQSIIIANRNNRKKINELDLIWAFLQIYDELSPVYTNSEFTDTKLNTPFNTLSHVIGTYYKEIWIKFDDIRSNLKKLTTYDIAISFAGEDRKIAQEIADMLKQLGYKVFYDDYEKADLWGKDLYEYLTEVYSEKAKYCLMIISKNYARKTWTNLERKAAQAKAYKENEEYILPLRIDDTNIPGVLDTIGYVDYNKLSVAEIVNLLEKKLIQ